MAALKTQPTKASVKAFIDSIDDDQRRKDSRIIHKIMRDATRARAKMWGASMVGYGSYTFTYASGKGGEWFLTGFAVRKTGLTLYIMPGFKAYASLLKKLGKHKTGKACLYINKLDDVDLPTLTTLIRESVAAKAKGD